MTGGTNVRWRKIMSNSNYSAEISEINETYDVVVVGGGTSGAIAAIAAAEEGLNTIIIERSSCLGGSSTGGQVTPMMCTGIHDCTSINTQIKGMLIKQGNGADDGYDNDGWFNPIMLKFLLEELYVSKGGKILYDTEFIDVKVENDIIDRIVVYNKGGLQQLCGKVFIDCTGDGDLAYKSGVSCFKGSEFDGSNQAVSLRFMLGNIELEKFHSYLKEIGEEMILQFPLMEIAATRKTNNPVSILFKDAVDKELLHKEDIEYLQAFSVPGMDKVLSFNCPQIPEVKDSLDPFLISGAYVSGKIMIKRIYEFLKNNVPGFEKSFILSVSSMLGVRESRRIKGKYILTEKDYNSRARFEDAIARTSYPVDVHGNYNEEDFDIIPMKREEYFEIPYRSLITDKISNMIVGGRCISSSFIAQSSIRVQPTCRAIGEACGIAAAYSLKNNIAVNSIDGKIIRKMMREKGANL